MKILYYSPHPDLLLHAQSGYGTHMREMIKAFERCGHDVETLIMGNVLKKNTSSAKLHSNGQFIKQLIKQIVPKFVWESLKDYHILRTDRQIVAKLDAQVQYHQPDLIYERAAFMQMSGVCVAQKYGIPHVLEMNSPYVIERKVRHSTSSLFHKKALSIEKKQLEGTHVAAVVSQSLKEHFIRQHDLGSAKIICTPNAIDPNFVKSNPIEVEKLLEKYRIRDRFVVGFVGSIAEYQRVDLLIRAIANLSDIHKDLKTLIVGDSPIVPELKRLSENLGISDYVIFTGRVPQHEVFNWIETMDIAVLPDNLWYGSPTKIFEYGALNKPVIAPNNVTMQNLIIHGKDGLLVNPDVSDLAKAILLLKENSSLRKMMAHAFHVKILEKYTWSCNVKMVLDTLSHIS